MRKSLPSWLLAGVWLRQTMSMLEVWKKKFGEVAGRKSRDGVGPCLFGPSAHKTIRKRKRTLSAGLQARQDDDFDLN